MPDVQVQTRNSVVHVSCYQPSIHGREVGQNSQVRLKVGKGMVISVSIFTVKLSHYCKQLQATSDLHQASNQDNDHDETKMFLTTC